MSSEAARAESAVTLELAVSLLEEVAGHRRHREEGDEGLRRTVYGG